MMDNAVTVVGEYEVTEGRCEKGPCWHVRGPAIHSVCETLNEARWGAGIAHSANVAGYKQGQNEATALRAQVAAMRGALEKWMQYDDADPMVKGECLREAREWTTKALTPPTKEPPHAP